MSTVPNTHLIKMATYQSCCCRVEKLVFHKHWISTRASLCTWECVKDGCKGGGGEERKWSNGKVEQISVSSQVPYLVNWASCASELHSRWCPEFPTFWRMRCSVGWRQRQSEQRTLRRVQQLLSLWQFDPAWWYVRTGERNRVRGEGKDERNERNKEKEGRRRRGRTERMVSRFTSL